MLFRSGLFAWVGFKSTGVEAPRAPREAGVSGAHTLKVLDLAMKGIFAHSYVPLRLITITGVGLAVASLVLFVVLLVLWITQGVPFAGFGTLVTLTLFLFGVLSFMVGIVSEYVGLIYEEVKRRPNFIVAETLGFPGSDG